MGQTWNDLLFLHWPLDPAELEPVVPLQLPLDTFEGQAWLGISPFVVTGLRLRWTTPVPVLSTFPEINVRTYVSVMGKPGIYFLSLDADSRSAVFAARRSYRLPYFRSRISVERSQGEVDYRAARVSDDGPPASFAAAYRATGDPAPAQPGSLDHWLTERYCLYTLDDHQRVHRGEIHHPPWPLRPAEARVEANTMTRGVGIDLRGDPLAHFSARQDAALWRIREVRNESGGGGIRTHEGPKGP